MHCRQQPSPDATAAEQAQIDAAIAVYNNNFSNGPISRAAAATALGALIAAEGAVRPNQETLVAEGGAGNDIIVGSKTGINYLYGGSGNDKIFGADKSYGNYIYGGAGTDFVQGGGLERAANENDFSCEAAA